MLRVLLCCIDISLSLSGLDALLFFKLVPVWPVSLQQSSHSDSGWVMHHWSKPIQIKLIARQEIHLIEVARATTGERSTYPDRK